MELSGLDCILRGNLGIWGDNQSFKKSNFFSGMQPSVTTGAAVFFITLI